MLTRCRVCKGISPGLPVPIGYSVCDCATNPRYWRGAKISVWVTHNWLTADGDFSPEQGWKELGTELYKSLHAVKLGTGVKSDLEEWDWEPEMEGGN